MAELTRQQLLDRLSPERRAELRERWAALSDAELITESIGMYPKYRGDVEAAARYARRELLDHVREYCKWLEAMPDDVEEITDLKVPTVAADQFLAVADALTERVAAVEKRAMETQYHAALTAACVIVLTQELAELKRRVARIEQLVQPVSEQERELAN